MTTKAFVGWSHGARRPNTQTKFTGFDWVDRDGGDVQISGAKCRI